MNIWQLVAHDHENIAYLIEEIPRASPEDDVVRSRGRLLSDLRSELNAHGRALDAGVLAPLSGQEKTQHLVADLRSEHQQITSRLNDLASSASYEGEAWLNAYADVAYTVDQHLHRHSHELIPAAREVLSGDAAEQAGRAFVHAKMNALRGARRTLARAPQSSELFLMSAVGIAVAALALIVSATGLLGTPESREAYARRRSSSGGGADRNRTDLAAAAAPGDRTHGENLGERQDKLLDQALEETFPGSDPISPKQITK